MEFVAGSLLSLNFLEPYETSEYWMAGNPSEIAHDSCSESYHSVVVVGYCWQKQGQCVVAVVVVVGSE